MMLGYQASSSKTSCGFFLLFLFLCFFLMSSAIFLETLQAAKSLRKECNTNNIEVISSGSFLTDSKSQIKHLKLSKSQKQQSNVFNFRSPYIIWSFRLYAKA